jgi:hypothetical protein
MAGRTSRTVPRNASSNRINRGPPLVVGEDVSGVGTVVVLLSVPVVVPTEDDGDADDAGWLVDGVDRPGCAELVGVSLACCGDEHETPPAAITIAMTDRATDLLAPGTPGRFTSRSLWNVRAKQTPRFVTF